MALDNLDSVNSSLTLDFKTEGHEQQYKVKLCNMIEHLRYQMTVIDELDKRIVKTTGSKLKQLNEAKNALNTTYVEQEKIESKIFESLKLFDLKLKAIKEKSDLLEENNRYNDNIIKEKM